MKLDKKTILKNLKGDWTSANNMQKQWVAQRNKWIEETYGRAYGNEVDGRSKIVSKDIKKQLEWLIPSITDPFLSSPDIIKCNPVTYEDAESARQNELLLNTQFVRNFPRYNFINKACRVLATEGTVVVQTGWDYEDEEIKYETEVASVDEEGNIIKEIEEETEIKVLVNKPTAIVCRNEDIFIDPTCMDDIDKCQFVIHRYEVDLSTLKADGRYKNLDKVAITDSVLSDGDFIPEDDTRFSFEDKARKKLLLYEYWGNYDINDDGIAEPIVCSWIGDTVIRLETNPYPDKKPPFIIVPFNSVPFQLFGEALAENIGDNQKVKTAITRGLIDNMARSNNAQVGFKRGALDMRNRKRFLSGENFEYNTTAAEIWQGSYNQLPSSAFDMLALMNNEIEAQTGTKSFSGGISGDSLGTTATAARGAMDATSVRRGHLVRNIAENMIKPLMRKWMAYNAEFLEEEEVIRVTNEEFVPIKRDDLDGKIDIEIGIATAEENGAKAQQLSFLLQTLGNNLPFEMTQLVMGDIARLSRMPDLEKQIRSYQPQPDPAEQQAKEIELQKLILENKKLEADIADKLARAGENTIDAELKKNKAMVEAAKARKLNSDADLGDLNYLKTDNMVDENLRAEEAEKDRQHQMLMAELQRVAGDSNIGMAR